MACICLAGLLGHAPARAQLWIDAGDARTDPGDDTDALVSQPATDQLAVDVAGRKARLGRP